MTRAELVLVLAALASFGFAWSAFLQQQASTHLAGQPGAALSRKGLPGAVRLLGRLVHSPAWFVGWVVNLLAFVVQAAALHLGSIAAVQPLMTTQVLFTIGLSSWTARRWPTIVDWLAGASICGGITMLMMVDGAAPLTGEADRGRVLLVTAAAAGAVAVLVVASRFRPSPALAALLLACAAGVCFAMTAMFMKLTTDDLIDRGVAATARDWVGYALAVSTSIGLALGQLSHAAGPLPWSMSAMNIVNPVVSYISGMIAFGAELPTSPGALAGIAGAAALLILGVIGLVHSPSIGAWSPTDPTPEVSNA
ncbi:DMT family transporter [Nocardioides sp. BP30]|uniref:DMT family transporter n=1 Tax=Nocardioides sp. BP30 TaxID=3036374 RepID=UPI0024693BB4|nr:DMT family transporter [Nocardioides sp. BP30]WGL53019.1 DMT family transporter [Nocardioides sp. BP30]